MQDVWERIEAGLEEVHPGLGAELRQGAAPDELDALERCLGAPIPPEVRSSWMVHDGTSPGRALLGGRQELLTVRGMQALWTRLCRRTNGASGRWNPAWVPFAADGLGDFLCIDLGPGHAGRVIEFWPDRGHSLVVAPSFRIWLEGLADSLESAPRRRAGRARRLLALLCARGALGLAPGGVGSVLRALDDFLDGRPTAAPDAAHHLGALLRAHRGVTRVAGDEALAAILEAW